MSPEFPSDNPELWQLRAPNVALALLLAQGPEPVAETESESEPESESEMAAEVAAVESDAEMTVEVVDFDDDDFAVVENESLPPAAPEAPMEDLFSLFVRTLVDVALGAGAAPRAAQAISGMLGVTRLDVHALDADLVGALVAGDLLARTESGAVTRSESLVANAHAWRATLLGEETEFSVSSMLDEWSAHIVATLLAAPLQKEAVRRELRARGIAAFGMLVEAA